MRQRLKNCSVNCCIFILGIALILSNKEIPERSELVLTAALTDLFDYKCSYKEK